MAKDFSKFQSFLLWIIEIGTFLILLTPLLVWKGVLHPYVFPKAIAFQVIVEIIFVAWLFLSARRSEFRINWRQPIVIAIFGFIAVNLLCLPFSSDLGRSLWSTTQRMMGVVNLIHFGMWFLVLTSTFKTRPFGQAQGDKTSWTPDQARGDSEKNVQDNKNVVIPASEPGSMGVVGSGVTMHSEWKSWRSVFIVTTIVGTIVSLGAIPEWASGDRIRTMATLGNSLYLGAYLMLVAFINALVVLKISGKIRWLFVASLVAIIFAILTAGNRSTLLALVVGLVIVLGYLLWHLKSRRGRIITLAIVSVLTIIFASGLTLRFTTDQKWGNQHLPFYARRVVYSNFDPVRLTIWNQAWLAFRQRPVFGWGLENIANPINKNIDFVGRDKAATDFWYDRVHNQFLEMLATVGVVGFLAYLGLYGAVFCVLYRGYRRWSLWSLSDHKSVLQSEKIELVVLASAFLAYIVQVFFSFDMPAQFMMLVLLMAYINACHPGLDPGSTTSMDPGSGTAQLPSGAGVTTRKTFGVALMIVLVFCEYKLNLLPLVKAWQGTTATQYLFVAPEKSLELYQKSVSPRTFIVPEIDLRMVDASELVLNRLAEAPKAQEGFVRFAAAELERVALENPTNYKLQFRAMSIERLTSVYDPNFLATSKRIGSQALALGPRRPEVYKELALAAILEGNQSEIERLMKETLDRTHALKIGETHFSFAEAYLKVENYEEMFKGIELAKPKYRIVQETNFLLNLARCLEKGQKMPEALKLADYYAARQKTVSDVLAARVVIYAKVGDKKTAEKFLAEFEKIDLAGARQVRSYLGW
ncbi:MAG: O-antigen ligase family protein [bacterium]